MNAHHHTPSQTKIELGCKVSEEKMDFIIWIKDWGKGIEQSIQPLLFDRRLSQIPQNDINQKQQSHRIGLYSVKLLVSNNQGKIWFEENPEGGAIFFVSFPGIESEKNEKGKGKGKRKTRKLDRF